MAGFSRRNKRYFTVFTLVTSFALLYSRLESINGFISTVRGAGDNAGFIWNAANALTAWARSDVSPNDFYEKRLSALQRDHECNFNPAQWSEGSGQMLYDAESKVYTMPPHVYSSTIRYEKSIGSDTTTHFVFVPKTDNINTIILYHDLFEIVVGDGDHYGVTFKANSGGGTMEKIGDRLILTGGIKIGSEVSLNLIKRPLANGQYEVVVTFTYTTKKGTENSVASVYTFPIPLDFIASDKPMRISVGFVNNGSDNPTAAYFRCFSVTQVEARSNSVALDLARPESTSI